MRNFIKSKKICIIIENLLYGGVTTHLINLLNSKKFNDCEITIITNSSNKPLKEALKNLKNKKVKIIYFLSLNNFILDNFLQKFFFHFLRPILFFLSYFQMVKILRNKKFDTILANCGGFGSFRSEIAGIFAAKLLGYKNINLLVHHNYTKSRFWKPILKFIELFLKYCVKNFIFVSYATKKSFLTNTGISPNNSHNIHVIHNGITLKKISKKKIHFFKNKQKKINVGMLSRIEEYKGQIDLVEGFSRLSEKNKSRFKVFLIGDGSEKELLKLKQIINSKRLNRYFKIIGRINEDSLLILNNLDLFFSLTRDFEGFGYSIAESLYVGVPVVSTKVGGTVEFLNNQNSYLIKPKDPKTIARLLINFVTHRKNWKKKAEKGKRLIISKFNSEEMAKKFYKIIF